MEFITKNHFNIHVNLKKTPKSLAVFAIFPLSLMKTKTNLETNIEIKIVWFLFIICSKVCLPYIQRGNNQVLEWLRVVALNVRLQRCLRQQVPFPRTNAMKFVPLTRAIEIDVFACKLSKFWVGDFKLSHSLLSNIVELEEPINGIIGFPLVILYSYIRVNKVYIICAY